MVMPGDRVNLTVDSSRRWRWSAARSSIREAVSPSARGVITEILE